MLNSFSFPEISGPSAKNNLLVKVAYFEVTCFNTFTLLGCPKSVSNHFVSFQLGNISLVTKLLIHSVNFLLHHFGLSDLIGLSDFFAKSYSFTICSG